ncbi:MAG: Gfo/Idh/MocA family oxidoreductase, partial [Verrucomicrobiota bacterium]|nr:Gfo/Idh/MocA family oxidoreductase [Verrucomicrobiota bacterium]
VIRELHLPALRSVPEITVAALADVDPERLKTAADQFRIPQRSSDPRDLFEDPKLDAVAICVPAFAHAELTLAALAAGKHVLVEKPLAVEISDGERMVAAAQASEKIAVIGFNLRCHRLMRRAREMVSSGALGRIDQVITVWGSDMQYDPAFATWRRTTKTGGGALFEIGVHHIDACAFLLQDKIETVQMLQRSAVCEGESVSLLARTHTGATISSSFSQVTSPVHEIRIVGDKGTLSFSPFRADSFAVRRVGQLADRWHARLRPRRGLREFPELLRVMLGGGDYIGSIREEWKQFAAAVRGETPPANSLVDGLIALRVIHAALDSGATGAPVKLSDAQR